MARAISYEYVRNTGGDFYHVARSQNKNISYSFLPNLIAVDMDRRILEIEVDDYFITMEEERGVDTKKNGYKHPLLPYAGKTLTHPIGEQLIAFCETNFAEHSDDIVRKLNADAPEAQPFGGNPLLNKKPDSVVKPKTREEVYALYYENYEELMRFAGNMLNASLYTSIFPPVPLTCSYEMLRSYIAYIRMIKSEYNHLLEFCFDADYFPDDLAGLTAASRFWLYLNTGQDSPLRTMSVYVQISPYGFGDAVMPGGSGKVSGQNINKPIEKQKKAKQPKNAFETEHGFWAGSTDYMQRNQVPIKTAYRCTSLDEMLSLELEKMIELNLKIKKCKNCGRYFILKGNYKTEYCDRIPDGRNLNCQTIAANAKFAQKRKETPALAIYSKAYKRYHARMKVGTVKPDAFKKWKYEAVIMRDKCLDGEVSLKEFREWIDGYFG